MRNNATKKILSIILAITVIAGLIPFTSVTHTKAAEEILSTDDFQYKIESDNTINIIKCLNTTDEEITIPEKINGYPVVKICYGTSDSFFSSDNTVTKRLNIPKSVTSINLSGLKNNPLEFINVDADNSSYASDEKGLLYNKDFTQLKFCPNSLQSDELVLPESVKECNDSAFYKCSKIKKIIYPKAARIVSTSYTDCSSLETIEFPDSATIKSGVFFGFSGCLSLKNIDFSNIYGLQISRHAFSELPALESVKLSGNVGSWMMTHFNNIEYAFYKCTALKEVDFANAEMIIGNGAFTGCTSLTKVSGTNNIIGISDYAFSSCSSLTQISFGDKLSCIGNYAFGFCTNLSDVTIPDTLLDIREYAFSNTALVNDTERYENGALYLGKHLISVQSDITSLSVKNGTLTISNSALTSGRTKLTSVTLPEGLTRINNSAFANYQALENINIPNTVTVLATSAFEHSGIKEIIIPDSVKTIGSNCFKNSKLESIILPDTDITLGLDCFSYTPLKSIRLPNTLKTLPNGIFANSSLVSITIPDSVETIEYSSFLGCKSLETVIIPESVTSIGNSTFYGCTTLKNIDLPTGLTAINSGLFNGCTSLEKIDIPANVKEIQKNAFLNCTSLKEVNLPNGLTKIGDSAFVGCESLTSIAIPKSVKSFGASVFNNYLKTVYFEGSEEEWNAITFGANNTPLEQATIIFNSTGTTVPDEPKDSITWSFDSSDGHLFLSGSGDMLEHEKTSDYDWYGFRNSIKSVTIGEGVTSVGANAFTGFVNLGEIIVGKDVKKIGNNSFAGCAKLSLISFVGEPSEISSSAFVGCNKRMTVIGENDLGKAFAQSNGFNYNPISFDSEKKVLNFGNTLTIYKDLPYTFIVYYVVKYSQSEYLHFDKLIFDGVIGDTISMDNVDKSAEYLTLNNLYVSLKSTDGEQISFARMLELLENGEYDAFKYVVKDDKNPEQEEKPKPEKKDFFEKIAEGLENLYTNALKTLSKVANFFRKLFK